MRAITLIDFEGGPALRDVPVPEPGANDVLVRVRASSVNGFDVAVAGGLLKGMMEYEFPVTVGADFAGVVERIGPEVSGYALGDEVFGFVSTPTLHDGTWADYIVVPEDRFVAPKPEDLSFLDAGVLPLAGIAALVAVDAVSPTEGERVLVVGATGGVGGYALQLASARGATVIATARADDESRLRELGASDTLDFRQQDIAAAVRERYPEGIHGLIDVVDFADTFPAVADLVVPGGRVATTVGAADIEQLAARQITATNVMAVPDPALLSRLAEHAASGKLRVTIQSVYSLEDALDAIREFSEGKRGKIALSIAED